MPEPTEGPADHAPAAPVPSGWSPQQPPPQAPPAGWGAAPPPPMPAAGVPGPGWAPPPQAPRPGAVPLRPLSVGEVLEGALRVYRGHWRVLVPVAAALSLVTSLLSLPYVWAAVDALRPLLALDPQSSTTAAVDAAVREAVDTLPVLGLRLLLASVASVVALVVVVGVSASVVGQAVLGRPAPWSHVRTQLAQRLGALVGTGLLWAGALLAMSLAVALPVWLMAAGHPASGIVLGVLLVPAALVGWTYASVRWVLAASAVVLERATPRVALARSWRLTAGQWWRTAGLLVLLWLVYGAISTVVSTPLSAVAQLGSVTYTADSLPDPDLMLALMLVSLLATLVTNAVVHPFMGAAVVIRYLDARMRTEGLADQLAAAADVSSSGPGSAPTSS